MTWWCHGEFERGFVYISFICLFHMLKIVGLFSGIVKMGLREMFNMKRWMQSGRGKGITLCGPRLFKPGFSD